MRQIEEAKIDNREITELLRSLAAAHLIRNKNRFQIIAYENAADSVEHLTREIKDIWHEGKLDKIPNIGKTIASSLDEYFRQGYSKHFQSILKGIPETVFELMKIPSIGPKKAYKLTKALKITNKETVFEDLKNLCLSGKIAKLETFGKKSQESILQELEHYQKKGESSGTRRMPLPYADALAQELVVYIRINKHVKRVDALGSLRRRLSTIGDIDIAASCDNKYSSEVVDHFISFPRKSGVINAGKEKASITVSPGIRVDFRVQEVKSYGSMLQYFTGSKNHNIRLREHALKKGLSLSEWGIKYLYKNKNLLKFPIEEKLYNFLELQYIPPEIREGTNEIEIAKVNKIPQLIENKFIKGDLHIHSNYDLKPSHDFGVNTYKEICKKAQELGYEYVGFSDHNPKVSNLSQEQIIEIMKKRKEHIQKRLDKSNGVNYFIGLELDIFPSGELALPKKAFEYVDYLLVSVHSSFRLDIKTMTNRVLKALNNPKVKILGHPTGRLLGKRDGYELEWEKIFEICKKNNIALEINAWPERLDLPDILVREALQYGVKLVINTDAHANDHMNNMEYGVSVARRGWAEKNDIINTKDYRSFKQWLES